MQSGIDVCAPSIEPKMKRLHDSLGENDVRRYAAIEFTKLGHGRVEYISKALQCELKTIRRGLAKREASADLDISRVQH
jgi:hypothetical protein